MNVSVELSCVARNLPSALSPAFELCPGPTSPHGLNHHQCRLASVSWTGSHPRGTGVLFSHGSSLFLLEGLSCYSLVSPDKLGVHTGLFSIPNSEPRVSDPASGDHWFQAFTYDGAALMFSEV